MNIELVMKITTLSDKNSLPPTHTDRLTHSHSDTDTITHTPTHTETHTHTNIVSQYGTDFNSFNRIVHVIGL